MPNKYGHLDRTAQGGWFKSRSQPYRSLTIERDEAPDPDVKHIAGEATGTRAERDTAMVEVLAVKR